VALHDHEYGSHADGGDRARGLIPRSGTDLPTWNLIMAGAMMALLPPVGIIVLMQRWFVKGLVESEK
jgi:sn-glycerol 3-phosphate transport system permease protein